MNGIVQAQFAGRFGNQLHQYCSARAWAKFVGARFECPDWIGARVFDLHDPLPSCELPEVNDGGNGLEPSIQAGQTNVRLGGYFLMQRWARLLDRSELQIHLRVAKCWLDLIGQPRGTWDGWYAAAHMRMGDYVGHWGYAQIPEVAYRRACEQHGIPLDRVVWVKENEPRIVEGIPNEIAFLPDFVALLRAQVLLRANSTFSWWAAILGDAREVFAPVVEDHVGYYEAPFVRGNWPRIADSSRHGIRVEDMRVPEG